MVPFIYFEGILHIKIARNHSHIPGSMLFESLLKILKLIQ